MKLLNAGVKLAVLRVRARIAKFKHLANVNSGGKCKQPFCHDPAYAEFNPAACERNTAKDLCLSSVLRHWWWADERKCSTLIKQGR